MLPGTVAYTVAGGALSEGGGDVRRTLGYLIAGVLIVLVSLIPRLLKRQSQAAGDLLKSVVIVLAIRGLLVASPAPVTATDSTACARLLGAHTYRLLL